MTTETRIKRVTEMFDLGALKPDSATVEITYNAETGEVLLGKVDVKYDPAPINDAIDKLASQVIERNGSAS